MWDFKILFIDEKTIIYLYVTGSSNSKKNQIKKIIFSNSLAGDITVDFVEQVTNEYTVVLSLDRSEKFSRFTMIILEVSFESKGFHCPTDL